MNRLNRFTTLAFFGALLLAASATSQANIIVVDTMEDSVTVNGNCSLREAVIAANTNAATDDCAAGSATLTDDIWVFVSGTIAVASQLPLLERVTLLGAGIDATTISGQGLSSVFYVNTPDDSHDVTISNLTVADGNDTIPGAGLLVDRAGRVRVENVRFRGNNASGIGGAIGTRTSSGDNVRLQIIRSRFENNTATAGAAIGTRGTPPYAPLASVLIEESTFTGNRSALSGGALHFVNPDAVSIVRSRFDDNQSFNFPGGAISYVTAASNVGAQIKISDSTLTNNRAGEEGGALSVNTGIAIIENSTFSGNISESNSGNAISSRFGAIVGIFHSSLVGNDETSRPDDSVLYVSDDASISMGHSIVWTAGTAAEPSCKADGTGSYASTGHNIDAGNSCTGLGTDYPNTDPELFALGDYGDGTSQVLLETFLPQPDSIAVDGGKDGPCTGAFGLTLATDQRGETRPVDGDGSGGNAECDIGAVEYQPGVDPVARILEIATFGTGSGRIVDAVGNILCTSSNNDCDQQLPDGATISLTAIASTGSVFTGWDEDCVDAGTGVCTLTMNQDLTVSAGFQIAAQPARLTVSKDLSEPGLDAIITSSPTGINCGTTCLANFNVGDVITLIAAPEPGTLVSGWAGCDSVSANGLNCTIALPGDSQVEAFLDNSGELIFSDGFDPP